MKTSPHVVNRATSGRAMTQNTVTKTVTRTKNLDGSVTTTTITSAPVQSDVSIETAVHRIACAGMNFRVRYMLQGSTTITLVFFTALLIWYVLETAYQSGSNIDASFLVSFAASNLLLIACYIGTIIARVWTHVSLPSYNPQH